MQNKLLEEFLFKMILKDHRNINYIKEIRQDLQASGNTLRINKKLYEKVFNGFNLNEYLNKYKKTKSLIKYEKLDNLEPFSIEKERDFSIITYLDFDNLEVIRKQIKRSKHYEYLSEYHKDIENYSINNKTEKSDDQDTSEEQLPF